MGSSNTTNILGISAFYHDSAACLVRDGEIVAAAQEERFTRKKHDAAFPSQAVAYCLREGGIGAGDLDLAAFYEKPFLKFDRVLHTYLARAPAGLRSFLMAIPLWIRERIWMKELIGQELGGEAQLLFPEHHESHAAAAFFPSPFSEAAFLTVDGVGEWTTTSFGVGQGNRVEIQSELHFPHSLGLLYSAFTYYTGFKVNSGEYKLMGLAPYGEPKYVDLILRELLDLKADGSFRLNLRYFNYPVGLTMTNTRFERLLGGPPRTPESRLTQRDMDLARSIQDVTEEIMFRMARHVRRQTGCKQLCLAGGVALNCVANGRILREGVFDRIWIQPAAGDAGGALGPPCWPGIIISASRAKPAARATLNGRRSWGRASRETKSAASCSRSRRRSWKCPMKSCPVVWPSSSTPERSSAGFRGAWSLAPAPSAPARILGDARSAKMQELMNLKIKFRESFRPFAPTVLRERASEYFDLDTESPYMLLVAPVARSQRRELSAAEQRRFGLDKLLTPRSTIPAVTHVDFSARVQTVTEADHPLYYRTIKAFADNYGCPVVINTSFNVRGEPIVCTPEQAYLCFMRTNMDCLVLGNFVLEKTAQKPLDKDLDWLKEFELD